MLKLKTTHKFFEKPGPGLAESNLDCHICSASGSKELGLWQCYKYEYCYLMAILNTHDMYRESCILLSLSLYT